MMSHMHECLSVGIGKREKMLRVPVSYSKHACKYRATTASILPQAKAMNLLSFYDDALSYEHIYLPEDI